MDPNIMKLLEEDEDETMHSGADVDAFTAELNRDIEGDASTSLQPSDSNSEVLSQGIGHTASQFLQQWQTSAHGEDITLRSGKDILTMEPKDQHPTLLELQQDASDFKRDTKEDDSTHEFKSFPSPSANGSPQPQDDQNTLPESRPMGMNPVQIQEPDNESYPERELELYKLQTVNSPQSNAIGSNNQVPSTPESNDLQPLPTGKGNQQTSDMGINNGQTMATMNQHAMETGLNSQHATTSGISNQQSLTSSNQQPGTTVKLNKQVPFGMLLPIIQPQLDKDRATQLQTLYSKLRKNEISKDNFVRHMRSLVGDQMLKMAVYKLQTQAAKNLQTPSNQHQLQPSAGGRQLSVPSSGPMSTDLRNPATDSNAIKSHVESQADSEGLQGLDKQQHPHFSQTSFPTYGSSGSNYSAFSATNFSSSTSIRPQLHDSQMRQASAHPNITSSHLVPTIQNTNVMNMTKFERPPSFSDPNKMQARTLSQMTRNTELPQNLAEWASATGGSSSLPYAKQEPVDQSSELQLKAQLNPSQGLSNFSSAQNMMSSLTAIGPGNYKAPLKKPLIGQKKQIEAPGSSPPSSKKQKVAGAFLDQSIEQLNDVTAVSGVNLREEEEQLFSGSKEDSRASEASRRVVQEEEERLILHKIPLQKQVAEIMAKSGLKNMNSDVERCLSLCVEERMRSLIANLIRLSKQRVDMEKLRHRTVITSDVRQKIHTINSKAREEWEKKQAETEKSQKLNETESDSGVEGDKDKDESRTKSAKANKDEDDKMRTTAANVAVRAATGVGDMLSKWQLMIEAKQKLGGTETPSGSQVGKDVARKPLPTSTRNTRESREADKRDGSLALNIPASVRKVTRNQIIMPQVSRSISVKDVIAILEREPQMSKSTLIYRLYDKIGAGATVEGSNLLSDVSAVRYDKIVAGNSLDIQMITRD